MKMVMAAVAAAALSVMTPVSSAHADPCGASSWVTSDGYQHVAYRNCGTSTVTKRGVIGGSSGICFIIRGGIGQELLSKYVQGRSQSWRVENC